MEDLSPKTVPFLDWHGIWAGYVSYGEDAYYFPQDLPRGIRLSVQEATLSEPVLLPERRWEGDHFGHCSVIRDGGRYRMWYLAGPDKEDPWVKAGHVPGKYPFLSCYAESADGFHWERPNLGLLPFDDVRDTNILFVSDEVGTVGYTDVIRDPHGSEAEQYKAIGIHSEFEIDGRPATRAEARELTAKRQAARDGQEEIASKVTSRVVIKGGVSPDGLRWTHLPEPIMRPPYLLDTQNILTYDTDLRKYVIYLRVHRERRRAVGRYESPDFREGWSNFHMALTVDPQDPPDWDIYAPGYCRHPHGAHLMFFSPFHRASGVLDVHLAISHDAMNWCRPERRPIIPARDPYQMVFAAPQLLPLSDDRWGVMTRASLDPHNFGDPLRVRAADGSPPVPEAGGYRWATWKRDRLVALEAEDHGEATLVERVCAGEQVRLNVATKWAGWVKGELVAGIPNRSGTTLPPPIPGYSFAECEPLSGDALDAPLRWKEKPDLSELRGHKIHLRLRMARAKLFAVTM